MSDKEWSAELEQEARDLQEAIRRTERALDILAGYSYIEDDSPWDFASAIQTGNRDKAETGAKRMSDKERIAALERQNKELQEAIRHPELALCSWRGYVLSPSVCQACVVVGGSQGMHVVY